MKRINRYSWKKDRFLRVCRVLRERPQLTSWDMVVASFDQDVEQRRFPMVTPAANDHDLALLFGCKA